MYDPLIHLIPNSTMVVQMSASPLSQDGQKQSCMSKVQAVPSQFLHHTWYPQSEDSRYLQAANVSDGAFR